MAGALGVFQADMNNTGSFFALLGSPAPFVAFPGGGKTNATPLLSQVASVGTVATSADSVLLISAQKGLFYFLTNAGASDMQVFGSGPDTINGVAAGTGISHPAGATYMYVCNADGAWTTTPTTGTFITGTFNAIVGGDSSLGITGQATLQGGAIAIAGGTSSTSGNAGGAVTVTGGTPGLTGIGGAVTMAGGIGGGTSGAGGKASVLGGAATASNTAGGAVDVIGGASTGNGTGGVVTIKGGAGGAATGVGAALTMAGGAGNTTGAGGAATLTGGAGGNDAVGGAVTITGGAAGGGNRAGGAAALIGGAGQGSQAGGAITITSGAAGATGVAGAVNISVGGATAGNGSAVTITGGAGASGTASGGDVNLVGGAPVSTGVPGEVKVNSVAGLFDACWQQYLPAAVPVSGTSYTFFMANRAYRVKAASCSCSSTATVPTVDVIKDTGTTAPGGGTSVLTGAMTFDTTANTRVVGTVSSTVATVSLAAGNRLALTWGGTVGSITGAIVSVTLVPV